MNGTGSVSVPEYEGTYLGSAYMDVAGKVSVQVMPTAASGGPSSPGALIGLYNQYNRVRVTARELDNKSSWTYTGGSYREADNSPNNRITYLDGGPGTGAINIDARYRCVLAPSNQAGTVGVAFDTTSSFPVIAWGISNYGGTSLQYNSAEGELTQGPTLGLNYVQAMEGANNTNTMTFYGTLSAYPSAGLYLTTEY